MGLNFRKKPNKVKRVFIDREKCIGCYNCVLACMVVKNTRTNNIYDFKTNDLRASSRLHLEKDVFNNPIPLVCRHCDEPECVLTCISGAMTKDEITGIVHYDINQCASCFMCIMSCPYGILKPDNKTRKTIVKCDLCQGEDIPACVENCPTGALTLEEVEKYEVFDFGG